MSNKYPGGIITSGASVGSSVAFDGSNDYLQVGSNAAFNFSASDCTIECWFFAATTPGSETEIVEFGTGLTNGDIQLIWDSGGQFTFGGSGQTKTRYTFPSGRWYYLAAVKSGVNWYLYIDGVQYVTQTSGAASSSNYVNIGSRNASGNWVTGNIYNLRISNVARYSGATAAMANVLTTDANTKLLTCVGRTITDLSGNNFAITVGGNAYMSSYGPPGYQGFNPALGAAAPGIWTLNQAQYYQGNRLWPIYDPYFKNTTLLLHGNGTNGAQNNTFLDSSSNNFTITRNGNTTQGTFTPFSQTGWSGFFTGAQTSPSLSFPTNAGYSLGSTSDFTVECWVYYTGGIGSETSLIERFDGISGPGWILGKSSGDKFWFGFAGSTYAGNTTVVANQWYHVCWMRTGGNSYLFVNGILDRAAVATTNFTDGTTPLSFGERDSGSQTFPFTGYMSNARIVKGTAVYSVSGFAVPTTPLTAVTNTTMLTLQSNRFVDNSTTAATPAIGSASSIQAFSPFVPTYSTPITYSNLFDGNTDYLSVPNNAAFDFGSGNFTIEMWVYPNAVAPSNGAYIYYKGTGGNFAPILIQQAASGYGINFLSSSAGTSWDLANTSFGTLTANAWNHIAICRSGSNAYCFLNGTLTTTLTNWSTTAVKTDTNPLLIGYGNVANTSYSGGISNLRVVKGTALYTSSFTPPTGPLTNITNTSLLTCQSSTFIDNSSNAFTITPNGNVQPVASPNPFGFNADQTTMNSAYTPALQGGSMFNSATPDGLKFLTSTTQFGISGDFTIELWVYPTSAPSAYNPLWILSDSTGSDNPSSGLYFNASYVLFWLNNGAGGNGFDTGTGINIVPFQWNHIAISRSGADIRCWTNGVLRISNWGASSIDANKRFLYIATNRAGNDTVVGYTSGFRFVNGSAVYSGANNFIPPTTPPTAITNTVALVNCTNAGIVDSTAKNALQTIGNAQISTAQSRFGGSSIAFDGTGDRLHVVPNNTQNLVLGTGDFTIELWLRPTSLPSGDCLLVGGDTNAAYLILTSAGALRFGTYNVNWIIGPAGTVSTGAWNHVAVTRSGTTVNLFLNGTAVTTAATSSQNFSAASYVIGGDQVGGTTALNGFIDDLRITKGYARYTSNFTVQTSQWQDQ